MPEIINTYDTRRKEMVDTQLITRGIRDERVLGAMYKVARHAFVLEDRIERAYDDMALDIGGGQTISQPYMVAVMTEILGVRGGDRVLEIGTGSGYQTAILAELAAEVFTIERIAYHSRRAQGILASLGYSNVHYNAGDGTLGWPEEAPFDRILVTAAAPMIPSPLIEQLSPNGGVLVAPVGERYSQQLATIIRTGESVSSHHSVPCIFVPLIGAFGWTPEQED